MSPAEMRLSREGASYFTALVDVLLACPSGYFEYRRMTTGSKEAVIHEWKEWMIEFSKSEVQVLRDVISSAVKS